MPLNLAAHLARSRSSSAKSQLDSLTVAGSDPSIVHAEDALVKRQIELQGAYKPISPKVRSQENLGTTVIRLRSPANGRGSNAGRNGVSPDMAGKDLPKLGPFKPMSYDELYVNPSNSAPPQPPPRQHPQQQPGNKHICQD